MIRSPLASRRAITHLARLRARPDEDGAGAALYCAMLLGLVVTTLLADTSHANRVERVALHAQSDDGVTLRLLAESPPAFQVFRIPGENTFALELPGSSLRDTQLEGPDDHPVLAQVRLDPRGKGTSRVVLRFLADVDYEASAKGRELELRFRALRDVTALRAAYQERQNNVKPQITAPQAAEIQRKETELNARGLALEKKEMSLVQARQALDEQRRDFEKERDAVLRLQKENAAKLDQSRAEANRQQQSLREQQIALQAREGAFASETRAYDEKRQRDEQARRKTADKERLQAQAELKNMQQAMQEAKVSREKWMAEVHALQSQAKQMETEAEKMKVDLANQNRDRQRMEASRTQLEKDSARERETFVQKQQEFRAQQTKMQSDLVELEKRLASLRAETLRETQSLERLQEERNRASQRAVDTTGTKSSQELALWVAREEQSRQHAESLQAQLDALRQQDHERKARDVQTNAVQQEQIALWDRQLKQERERFSERESAWQKREEQLKNQVASLQAKLSRDGNSSAPPPGVTGFGGPEVRERPAVMPTTNGRLFEFGQGNRMGGALHHLSVQRQGLFSSRVGLQIQGKIRYSVQRQREREVILTLYDTYAANLAVRRILDTRDLGTNVLRILPRVVESEENKVILTIELRQAAAVSASSESGILWLQFGQPGS